MRCVLILAKKLVLRYGELSEIGLIKKEHGIILMFRNLRHLSLPSLHSYGNLRLSQFEDFPPGLEEISLGKQHEMAIKDLLKYQTNDLP